VFRVSHLGHVVVALVAAVVGFVLVGQFRGERRFTSQLQAESESDLARILSSLNGEADSLRDEIAGLRLQLQAVQTSSRRDDAALRAAQDQLADLEVLAGTVPVHGPGVVVTVSDPDSSLRYDSLIDLVEELRDAGAEALAVNGQRVGTRSAFFPQGRGIALDGTVLSPPYKVTAIGQPPTLETGLGIRGGAVETLSSAKSVHVDVARQPDLVLPALQNAPTLRVSHPVGS
jgi:uncharacterized protein YlxW (UPF0749 family)